jgi:hypothetical protein
VRFAVSAPVACDPDVAFVPLHAPEAVQEVALVLDQESVLLPPDCTEVGLAVRFIVGAAGGGVPPEVTVVTVVEPLSLPPAPEHASVNVRVAVSEPVLSLPESALFPDQAPEAEHEVAFVVDQLRVELEPDCTVVGFAEIMTVGAPATRTVTESGVDPPAPVQVSVYVVWPVRGPTDWLPCVFFEPLHPPLAVQLEALLVVQLRVELPFSATVVGLAIRFTVGGGVEEAIVTATDRPDEPPLLLAQVSVKVVLAASGPRTSLPAVALLPDQPPLAVQLLALVLDQVSVVEPCDWIVVGLAERLTVGCVTPLLAVSL